MQLQVPSATQRMQAAARVRHEASWGARSSAGRALLRCTGALNTIRRVSNRDPEWNQPFTFHPANVEHTSLALLMYDSDQFSEDDLLAYTVAPLSSFLNAYDEAGEVYTVDYNLCPSQMQINRTRSVAIFAANKKPEPITLRVSICLHLVGSSIADLAGHHGSASPSSPAASSSCHRVPARRGSWPGMATSNPQAPQRQGSMVSNHV